MEIFWWSRAFLCSWHVLTFVSIGYLKKNSTTSLNLDELLINANQTISVFLFFFLPLFIAWMHRAHSTVHQRFLSGVLLLMLPINANDLYLIMKIGKSEIIRKSSKIYSTKLETIPNDKIVISIHLHRWSDASHSIVIRFAYTNEYPKCSN